MQVSKAVENAFCYFTKDFLACTAAEFLDFAVDGVEAATFAEFHADADAALSVIHISAIVLADMC